MSSHNPNRPSRHAMPAPSTATVKSSYMSDKIRNAPTLGPGDSLSQMSRKSSHVDPSHSSRAPKSHASGMSGHSRRGASRHLSAVPEVSTISSSSNSNLSWAPMSHASGGSTPQASSKHSRYAPVLDSSHVSWSPMSHASGGSTPQASSRHSRHAPVLDNSPQSSKNSSSAWFSDEKARSAYQQMTHSQAGSSASNASRGQSGMHAPSRHTATPSYTSGAAGPSGSHRSAAPISMSSNMSGQGYSSSGSRQPEPQMCGTSGASRQMSQASGMSGHGSQVSSSSRQSASPGSQNMSMTQHGGRAGHRSVVPSPLGQAPVHNGFRGTISTPEGKPGETVEVNINIRTTRK
ncbi:uncharacterized protein LAJ45_11381 [Morchella importuna]|uniref:Uncharacterized protein n=1 Tax=Morchella conica CCBAS932 TaxID=1392247 RepID=A0A3N4KCW7_9PEZI|nr:uncharacterized protein LAJ45_11381 [Morchella importuna]KAH8144613.1 hypothetical protein LAJ45_11381 [Morchella importuna]RPB08346.1 hypothetical protein P167DRAFT_548980 [Morchella conica CCBAS932]